MVASGASASQPVPGVRILGCALHGGHATTPAGTDVFLLVGEVTKTRGLDVAWQHDLVETSSDGNGPPLVDGVPISNPHQYWNAPIPNVDQPGTWVTWWIYDTGITLATGQTMTVDFNLLIEHPLTDGLGGGAFPAGLQLPPTGCTITAT